MKTYYESELKELEGKKFTDVKELEKAEAEVNATNEKKEVALAEKKQELAEINSAAKTYLDLVKENKKKRDAFNEEITKSENEAYKIYKEKIDEFSKKHNGYHLTYKYDGENIEFQIEEVKQKTIQDHFKEMEEARKQFNDFWNSFNCFWF
jgi:hypothetical protein